MSSKVTVTSWDILPDGRQTHLYTLSDGTGRSVTLSDYGGIVTSVIMPDIKGVLGDIALGYDTLQEYLADDAYLGATVGRFANRIAGASFELGGKRHALTANEGGNTLHGGTGFSRKLWDAEVTDGGVRLRYMSPDGEDGFPGTLDTTVTVTFDNSLVFDFHAVSDKDTIVSLTNHAYFNLAGGGDVLSHLLTINADDYLAVGPFAIPTDRTAVNGTPFDFRAERPIGNGWYDHCYVLTGGAPAARVVDPASGRTLEIRTNMPAVQFYAAAWLSERRGKNGAIYTKNSGLDRKSVV
jgi:aldose 1-epimerase